MCKLKIIAVVSLLSLNMYGCSSLTDSDNNSQASSQVSVAVNASTEEKTEEKKTEQISTGYIDAGKQQYVSLFQKPDSSSAVIARLYTGDEVGICALVGNWSQISSEGLTGYVLNQNIVFQKPEEEQVTTSTITTTNTESPVKTTATPMQANVTIVLKYDSQGIALPSSYPTYLSYSDTRNGYCSAHACYMYKTASKNGPKRAAEMLYEGDAVTIYGEYNNMYYLGTDSGSGYDWLGYVPKEYIKIGTPPASERKNYNAVAGIVDATACHLRSTPSKKNDNNIIATVKKGFEFQIISFDGFWYLIRYNGGTAYISHKMVKVW